ncbi:hypothetical protein SAMN05216276_1001303 [Streptosporangium subroseum]|uniref:Uncharacterized protein n=1 Tax=Streptosporangium subroseum TaxID=106412 RepID=A0A239ADF7_9ACTN|nr:hypothetical protein SAMN05216276_1001303 [Streptosporangium subroseum]
MCSFRFAIQWRHRREYPVHLVQPVLFHRVTSWAPRASVSTKPSGLRLCRVGSRVLIVGGEHDALDLILVQQSKG